MMLQPADTTKRLGIADSTSSSPLSPPLKNASEEEVARYVLTKAAHDALEGDEVEVWQSQLFWEYVFVRALEDDIDRVVRATDGKMRRIRSRSNSKNKGSWSVTTKDDMEVGQIGSARRKRTNSLNTKNLAVFSFENVEGTALSSSRRNIRRKSSGSRGSLASLGSVGSVGSGGSRNGSPESPQSDSEMTPVLLGWTEHSQRRASPPTLPALHVSTTGSVGSTSAPSTPVAASVGSASESPFAKDEDATSVYTPSFFSTEKVRTLAPAVLVASLPFNGSTTPEPIDSTPGSYSNDSQDNDSNQTGPTKTTAETTVLEAPIDAVTEEEEETNCCTYIKNVDDSILQEAIYEEMMDLVLIMLRVGVGADRTHAFVHWVFAAHGMTTEEDIEVSPFRQLKTNVAATFQESVMVSKQQVIPSTALSPPSTSPVSSLSSPAPFAASTKKLKISKWLSTVDTLVENVARARAVERQFLEGGMDALMAMAEAEMLAEEKEENKEEDNISSLVAAASPVRHVHRKSLIRHDQDRAKQNGLNVMQRITELTSSSNTNDHNNKNDNKDGNNDNKKTDATKSDNSEILRNRAASSRRLSYFNSTSSKNKEEDVKKKTAKQIVQPQSRPSFFDLDRVIGRTLATDVPNDRVTVNFLRLFSSYCIDSFFSLFTCFVS